MMLSPHSSRTSLILYSLLGLLVGQSTGATIVPGGQYAVVGEDYNLTCAITSPVDKVIWYQGSLLIKHHYENCTATVINGNPRQQYRYLCPNNTHFVIVMQGVAITKERGLMWKCMTNNSHSAEFRIDVFSEPKRVVKILEHNGSAIMANQNFTSRCLVDGGYPLANLSWSCNGSDVVGFNESTSDKAISVLTLPVNQSDSGLICTCTAKHPLWQKALTNQTKPLIVLYPSSVKPVISGYESLQPINENTAVNLTCTVPGGFPLTTLDWYCNGVRYPGRDESSAGVAKSVLRLPVNRTYHQRQCVCKGTSVAGYDESSYVTFNVHYSAVFMNSRVHYDGELNKALAVRIQFYSNPEISSQENVTWFQDRAGKLSSDGNFQLEFNLTEEQFNISILNNVTIMNGQSAIMEIKNLSKVHLGRYRLSVQNGPDLNSTLHFEIREKPDEKTNKILYEGNINAVFVVVLTIGCVLVIVIIILAGIVLKCRKKNRFRRNGRFQIANRSEDSNPLNGDKMIVETGYGQVQDENDSPILAESGYSQVKVVNTPNGPECLYIDDGEKTILISDGPKKENTTQTENADSNNGTNPDHVYAKVQKDNGNADRNGGNGEDMNTNNKQNTNNEHLNGQNAEANKNNKINDEQDVNSTENMTPGGDIKLDNPESANPQKAVGFKNEAFNYAELQFSPQTDQRFKIIGTENSVEYAEVAATLPPRDVKNGEDPPKVNENNQTSLRENENVVNAQRKNESCGKPEKRTATILEDKKLSYTNNDNSP